MSAYTEDILVQQTTARLPGELGWQSAYAFNDEDFGPGSLLGLGPGDGPNSHSAREDDVV